MDKLKGIFQGQDMLFTGPVDQVDHRRQGGRFSAAGRPGNQHHALFETGHFKHPFRQIQLLGGKNRTRDKPKNRSDAPMGIEDIAAKTCQTGDRISKIKITGFFEGLFLFFIEDFKKQRFCLLIGQIGRLDPHHFAMQAKDWRCPAGDMQIAGSLLLHHFEQCIDFCHPAAPRMQIIK